MAVGRKPNFRLADGTDTEAHQYDVAAGAAASIKAGDLVLKSTVYGAAVGTAVADTDDVWIGFAATDSTDTATAAGTVMVYDDPDAFFVGLPLSTGTPAVNTFVTLDSAATGVQRLKETDTTKGVCLIQKVDATSGEITFRLKQSALVNA